MSSLAALCYRALQKPSSVPKSLQVHVPFRNQFFVLMRTTSLQLVARIHLEKQSINRCDRVLRQRHHKFRQVEPFVSMLPGEGLAVQI